MFIGLDLLTVENSLQYTSNTVKNINRIIIKNAIYDEVNIKERTDYSFDINKTEWQYDNLLLAKFRDNLSAGNVDFAGMTVAKLIIKRRKKEEFEWQYIGEWNFDSDKVDYEYYDKYVEALQEYEYIIVPQSDSGIEGNIVSLNSIIPEFEGVFLMDKANTYKLLYNLEYDSTERVQMNEIQNPIGSKYPILVTNGATNYETGAINALCLSDSTVNSDTINRKQEKIQRKALLDFLTNKKPKILKDLNGNLWLVGILGNPSISYINELNQGLANINFKWVELGDGNSSDDLLINGLL